MLNSCTHLQNECLSIVFFFFFFFPVTVSYITIHLSISEVEPVYLDTVPQPREASVVLMFLCYIHNK